MQTIFQTRSSSFVKHNAQFELQGKLEIERSGVQKMLANRAYDSHENKISRLLALYSNRELCVDIGSGNGWYSSYISQFFDKVESIEPSEAGISIAKKLHPEERYPNISWNHGFAETILKHIPIDKTPTLFITGCVLSHLRDKEVISICKIVNQRAKVGSALSWSECWGKEFHKYMWHCRTKEWWRKHLSNWDLDFHGGEIENVPGRHKGFHGIKVR